MTREYLKRINLYRKRLWTCKVTAKGNLTYEEALVSEQQAMVKVQQFPEDLIGPVLRIIQYSTLPLIDLVNLIREKMMDPLAVGVELSGKMNGSTCPCRIVEVLEEKEGKTKYKVAWLEEDHKSKGSAIVSEVDLIRKKLPFTRNQLKSFIRESTYRNAPWVIHDKLALKYGISTDPPEELQSKEGEEKNHKRNRVGNGASEDGSEVTKEHIKYPIDDLLVQHPAGDPVFCDRPSPSIEFSVPVECVGDLLMVWDFCTSFGKLLELLPFSLEYLEKAICHKESNTNLIVETHASLLRLLIKDEGNYYAVFKYRKRRPKITLVTWTDNLCDFLEMIEIPAFTTSIATIKRGHYGLLDAQMKLRILRELVNHVLATNLVKATLDEGIERWQALAASKREEALEDGRKRREAKELLKAVSVANGANGPLPGTLYSVGNNLDEATKKHLHSNGIGAVETSSLQKHALENGDGEHEDNLREMTKQLMEEMEKNKEQRKEDLQWEMEKRLIRTNPLGKDRDHNRYWFFRRDGRVFVEGSDFESWGYYSSSEEVLAEMQKRNKENARRSAAEEAELRRSSRVRAPPRENPALAFLKYVNQWKGD
ncbi:DDT domain-containing protein [Drosera capensis]